MPAAGRLGAAEALVGFRSELHNCLFAWADALFELCDALLCAPGPVASVPALSLEPVFRRSHGSLYKALANASVDTDWLRRALVAHRPQSWPLVFAVDASTWARCDAECSPERGFHYSASRHSAGQPIVAGWSYQWISQLGWAPDSWTAPLDTMRIKPSMDPTTATIDQLKGLVGLLPADGDVPLFVLDAGYDPIAIGAGLAGTRAQVLVRIRSDRVFYPDPSPPVAGTAGRPRRHGNRFGLSEPDTWTKPDSELCTHDPRYGDVRVQAWHGLHPRLAGRGRWAGAGAPPIVRGTVIRVEVEHLPKPTARAVKTLWLWWSGPDTPDLDVCWRAYLRRFDIEHTFRVVKGTLGWTTPALCTPSRPTAGPGSLSAPTPSYGWPEVSSPTTGCRGSGPVRRPSSPRHGCEGGFADLARPSARRPVHRNPIRLALAAPKAPAARHEPATRRSRRPPDHARRV